MQCRTQPSKTFPKLLPLPAAPLPPSPKLLQPHPQNIIPKCLQPRPVPGNREVLKVAPHHQPQPIRRLPHILVHPLAQLRSNFFEFGGHTFADGSAYYDKFARRVVRPTDVSETQKFEGLRLPFPALLAPLGGIAPEFDQARLVRV